MHDRNDPEIQPSAYTIGKGRIAIRQPVDERDVCCLIYMSDSQQNMGERSESP